MFPKCGIQIPTENGQYHRNCTAEGRYKVSTRSLTTDQNGVPEVVNKHQDFTNVLVCRYHALLERSMLAGHIGRENVFIHFVTDTLREELIDEE